MKTEDKICKTHGVTSFRYGKTEKRWRCRKCASEAVSKRRRLLKHKAVMFLGGKCSICGYNKCIQALEFHHLDPSHKDIQISSGNTISWEKLERELSKCKLLCANCHREVHNL